MPDILRHAQIVWDQGAGCTAQTHLGPRLVIGPEADWTPDQLLIIAVEAGLMEKFLQLARRASLEVLGYVSAARGTLEAGASGAPSLLVRPCIVVEHERDRDTARRLLEEARACSTIVRALGGTVRCDPEIVAVAPIEPR